jgi:hypothetical protein
LLRGGRSRLAAGVENIRYRVSDKRQQDALYAFYDLAVSPATFDIVTFLVLAELARKQSGRATLHVVIVPGPNEGFRVDGAPYDTNDKRWRLRNILAPSGWLIPGCRHVTVCASRDEARVMHSALAAHVFPPNYSVAAPLNQYDYSHVVDAISRGGAVPSVEAPPRARHFMRAWLVARARGRRVITITLRECTYERDRNSNLQAWGAFARGLDPALYCPVIVRDIEAAVGPLPEELDGLLCCNEAAWNLELRAALYELSDLNMSVSNGPCILLFLNPRSRFLLFKMVTPSCGATTEQHLRAIGLEPGAQFLGATRFQRLVWKEDDLSVLEEAFREIQPVLEWEECAPMAAAATH